MPLSHINEVSQTFKDRITWWICKLNNIKLKIWQDQWLDFILCWLIFDAYLTEFSQSRSDKDKLDYFYQNNSDLKNLILEKWTSLFVCYVTKLKKNSPIQDMRPNSDKWVYLNDENDLIQVFNFIYQIRCNLFHGAKDIKNEKDSELVRDGSKFLHNVIDLMTKGRNLNY